MNHHDGALPGSRDQPAMPPEQERTRDLLVLGLASVLYVPLIFMGYGSDNDTYNVLDSGRTLWTSGQYVPSRNPGFPVHEAVTGLMSGLGGSVLSNAVTLAFSLVALASFLALCRRLEVPCRHLASVALMVTPVYWINSTCTSDYVWALALVLLGFALLLRGRSGLAGLALGLATGARLASLIAVGIIVAWVFISQRPLRRATVRAALLAIGLSLVLYLPSFLYAGRTLGFLEAGTGGSQYWTLWLRIGRFVYKNVYVWGLPAFLLLLGIAATALAAPRALLSSGFTTLAVVMIAGYELLFLKYPLEKGYLLFAIPFLLMLAFTAASRRPLLLRFLTGLLVLQNLVSFELARPDQPGLATGATFAPSLQKGDLWKDLLVRHRLRDCSTLDCWKRVVEGS